MIYKEWLELETRMNSQEIDNWVGCSLKIKGLELYPLPEILRDCVGKFLRDLEETFFDGNHHLDKRKLRRAALFAHSSLPNLSDHYFVLIEDPNCPDESEFGELIDFCWFQRIEALKSKIDEPPDHIIGQVDLISSVDTRICKVDSENTYLPPAGPWDGTNGKTRFRTRPLPTLEKFFA